MLISRQLLVRWCLDGNYAYSLLRCSASAQWQICWIHI